MKRKSIITVLALVLVLALSLSIFSACNKKHKYSSEWKFDEKTHWHECTTKKHTDTTEKTPHVFTWTEKTPAGFHTDKVEKGVCECGYETERTISGTATHTYGEEWKKDESGHWHDSTCDATAPTHDAIKGNFAAHTFDEGVVTKPADYGVVGEKKFTCTVCEYSYTQEIDALGAKDNTISFANDLVDEKTYDGLAFIIDPAKVNRKGDGEITITYKGENDTAFSETAPINAGEYTVKATVKGTAEWKGGEITTTIIINKREITLPAGVFERKLGENLESGKFGLTCINVAAETNNVVEWVSKGARLAERGEFTRRAFLNGKMDLSDAEGVIDMINADSADAVKAAYRLMTGKLSKAVKDVQNDLKTVLTGLVAVLDYPEELEDETLPSAEEELEKIVKTLTALQNSRAYGKMIKEGMDVALVGDTNVGKSSLMNAILGYDRAIVSSIKGTTRDFISDSFELSGKKINLCDTAGIRESNDEIEKEGINRSISIVKDARLVLRVLDATQGKPENKALENALSGKKVVEVYNKSDLINNAKNEGNKIFVSAKTGDGIDELLKIVAKYFDEEKTSESEVLTSERQLSSVTTAKEKVEEGLNALKAGVTTDCVISVLTEGYTALGEITGETVSEKIIDDIFDKFCVGK